jgi:hypothetical protein
MGRVIGQSRNLAVGCNFPRRDGVDDFPDLSGELVFFLLVHGY